MSSDVFRTVVVVVRATLLCNFDCDYCYISQENRRQRGWLEPRSMKRLVAALGELGCQAVTLSWQGGEPTLAGRNRLARLLDAAQSEAETAGIQVRSCLHTNGTLIDDRWARFFRDRGFSVGVSIDAHRAVNDRHRRWLHSAGRTSPHDRAMAALDTLRVAGVPVEVTSTLADAARLDPDDLYTFYRSLDVERINVEPLLVWTPWKRCFDGSSWLRPYSKLLLDLLRRWIADDVRTRPRIQYFELLKSVLHGGTNDACHMSGACWNHVMVQPNGDVFPCDQFGDDPRYLIANTADDMLSERLREMQLGPLARKADALKRACQGCTWFLVCRGGCLFQRLSECSLDFRDGGYVGLCERSRMFSAIAAALGVTWPGDLEKPA